MKVLFIHNHYGVRSGEEVMIERIMALLTARGHQVDTFFRHSADIEGAGQKVSAAMSGVWSQGSRNALRKKLQSSAPDVVQIQNLFPLISPAVLPVISEYGCPVVMRLSNYRLICPNGLFLSHGEVCERCRGGNEWQCVRRNCESSLFKSTAYALRNWTARRAGFYRNHVTRLYAQTQFQRDTLIDEGFDPDRIDVIPNMVDPPAAPPDAVDQRYFAFVGRLSAEKGIDTLFEAARLCPTIPIKCAGHPGDYERRTDIPANVELVGPLDRAALDTFYSHAAGLVAPSVWYEGFPGVIIEAMVAGLPVITSDIGGLPEIVENGRTGIVVPPAKPDALAQAISALWQDDALRSRLGQAGFDKVKTDYTPDRYYQRLMDTYTKAGVAV